VQVKRGDKWESTVVETGVTDGSVTEIKSGLQEGDVVQVTPTRLETAPATH
jgi:hypothetical protein